MPPESTLGKFVQGDNRVLLLAHGIVKAGVDLKQIRPEDVARLDAVSKIELGFPHEFLQQFATSSIVNHRA